MDEYGFAAAAQAGMRLFAASSRRCGRTSRLIERVTADDQIVVLNEPQRREIERRLRDAGKKVRVIAAPPGEVFQRVRPATGRTFFEHTWIEQYFEDVMNRGAVDLEMIQRQTSKTWPEKPEIDDSARNLSRLVTSR